MPVEGQYLKWGIEQRMEFIEFRLFWEGGVNRSDITSFFGVSVPQASKDLTRYQEIAPGNAEYDKSEKKYIAAAGFKPVFLAPNAETYLSRLVRTLEHEGNPNWLLRAPAVDFLPTLQRRVDVPVLRTILSALRKNTSMEVLYQSMNPDRPKPAWRCISPHAFGNDGLRWHVRAYCHIDNKFKDFLLSRCEGARLTGDGGMAPAEDTVWTEFFDVSLVPNPRLSEAQQKAIAMDYGMVNSVLIVPVRKAMLYYFGKRLRLDLAEKLDHPKETPVVIWNRADFEQTLAEASR